ncbi:MAG: DUF3536 domain-containing protein [Candidatus Magnetominusculus sp. LBB02]|nr:DUF3536 domain-containing protein [Candidatus Magnetominusculus sp. LBB02]
MERYICIHGHFYQPPRENPWLEEVEYQESAAPYHDWNERITEECYASNAASQVLDDDGQIIDIINNYCRISFNFGPTLLSWLQRHKPDVYQAILEADRQSMERFGGHGAALAQVYNHMIMPLASQNDKQTQVVWGIRDFKARFGRLPEGIWLAETAVDRATLEVLVDNGILFTILAPRQAARVKRPASPDDPASEEQTETYENGEARGQDLWTDVSEGRIDPAMPYICRLPSGRTITLFFYDGPISGDIAFSGVLHNGRHFAERLVSAFSDERDFPQLVHIATDGETYGHHHKMGEMALTYCLFVVESEKGIKLTNYGQYLEQHPPTYEVEIYDGSSWSCIHGIGRWQDDCGCGSGMHHGWTQQWRRPLRDAMDWLRDRLAGIFEIEGTKYLKDPWQARNNYIDVILDRDRAKVHSFIDAHAIRDLPMEDRQRVLKLLEMQRNSMLMYTSCGWFFDEISGIETVQIMDYAARAMQYAQDLTGISLEGQYIERLRHAQSNIFSSGAHPYEQFVMPSKVDIRRAAAHYAILSMFEYDSGKINMFCYTVERLSYEMLTSDGMRLGVGKICIASEITWDERTLVFAVLNLDDHSINCRIKEHSSDNHFNAVKAELTNAFSGGAIENVSGIIESRFGGESYSFSHLFRDGQRRVLDILSQGPADEPCEGIDNLYRRIYEGHHALMDFYNGLCVPLPQSLLVAAAYTVEKDLMAVFVETSAPGIEKLRVIRDEIKKWTIAIDINKLAYHATPLTDRLSDMLSTQRENIELYERMTEALEILQSLSIKPNLWKARKIYFIIRKEQLPVMSERAHWDEAARRWIEVYGRLGDLLGVKQWP